MSHDSPIPWRNWYHCMGNTYGTWLPGDDRGFRTRHHDGHVEGDYKNPPQQGKYDQRRRRAERDLKRPPVRFTVEQRRIICLALGEKLIEKRVEVVELSVSSMHFHVLARFTPYGEGPECPGVATPGLSPRFHRSPARRGTPYDIDPAPRELLGVAKRHTSHVLRKQGRAEHGGLWAVRTKVLPVQSRAHQLRVVKYIRGHEHEGAAVWSLLRDEL